ncbi:thymidine kinase [Mycoplasma sp. P36-A1]|uniref:thymidine kinase n=1 Tax=Mycoplasma sp. P36-A1 TaxID=3252900 RepID=UPI003C2D616B
MKNKIGNIEVVAGCMFAGKTEELIRHAHTLSRTNHQYCVIKPKIDNRYGKEKVVSHNGNFVKAIEISKAIDILTCINEKTKAVLIDEAQFFDDQLEQVVTYLINQGIDVVAVGLDMDFRAEPFPVMSRLLARANKVNKITSYCAVCNEPATRTQRLIDGKPASYNDPIVLIGAQESYEPRCSIHHEVADYPKLFEGETKNEIQ